MSESLVSGPASRSGVVCTELVRRQERQVRLRAERRCCLPACVPLPEIVLQPLLLLHFFFPLFCFLTSCSLVGEEGEGERTFTWRTAAAAAAASKDARARRRISHYYSCCCPLFFCVSGLCWLPCVCARECWDAREGSRRSRATAAQAACADERTDCRRRRRRRRRQRVRERRRTASAPQ